MATQNALKKEIINPENKIVTVHDFLKQKRDLIAKALPNTITTDRLIGVFTMLLNSSPALMECTQSSLVAAVIQTVQLGLTPGNVGHCHYIPFSNKQKDGSYRKEIQFIIGYRGMLELVNRSGQACILTAECVYEKDQFQYEQGLHPILKHIPAIGERGPFVAVYCIAKNLIANEKVFIVLQKEEVEKIKNASKASKSEHSPWTTWWEEMCKKSAAKRICKLLPLSLDVQKKINTDETIKNEIDRNIIDVPDTTNWEDQKPPAEEVKTEWEKESVKDANISKT